jgi:hypothetical protein
MLKYYMFLGFVLALLLGFKWNSEKSNQALRAEIEELKSNRIEDTRQYEMDQRRQEYRYQQDRRWQEHEAFKAKGGKSNVTIIRGN